ncbi:MAG: AfsR/SARP family transcriptional regulator [Marmoricola sp.]|nr:AfsR/SARP family transcriptional regulator [Marmoricola sp.]
MLALASPHGVSTEQFVDGLWGEDPPTQPVPALQVFVHGLRKALRTATEVEVVERVPAGYRLAVPPEAVDVTQFVVLHERARELRTQQDAAREAQALGEALALWRGPALADVRSCPFAEVEATRLEELRLLAEEDLYDAQLRLGMHQELVGTLDRRVREHPANTSYYQPIAPALIANNLRLLVSN